VTQVTVVGENAKLRLEIEQYLLNAGHNAVDFHQCVPKGGQLSAMGCHVAAIILDLTTVPRKTLTFLTQFKEQMLLTPVVAIVKSGDVGTAVQSMRLGAIDVLSLPFDRQTFLQSVDFVVNQFNSFYQDQMLIQQSINLLETVRAKFRMEFDPFLLEDSENFATGGVEDSPLQLGEIIINTQQEKVFFRQLPLDLTPSQYKILAYLGAARGRVVPFEELYSHLHGVELDRTAARTALSAHLSYLRMKLSKVNCEGYLVNIRGRGYLLQFPEDTEARANSINLDLILEKLPVLLWTTNKKLVVTSIRGSLIKSLNLNQEEILGFRPEALSPISDELLEKILSAYRRVLRGESVSLDAQYSGRFFHGYFEPAYNVSGEITGCIGLAVEITQQLQTERVYQRMVEHSLLGQIIYQDNRIVFANRAMTECTGFTIEELLDLDDPSLLIFEADKPTVLASIQKSLVGEAVLSRSVIRLIHKNGSLICVEQISHITNFQDRPAIHTTFTNWNSAG
jgi:PAS domain S-box-containing protein